MTPAEALAQRHDALARANNVRMTNAQIKKDVNAGRRTLAEAIRMPTAQSLKVETLILSMRYVGKSKANSILWRIGISPSKLVGAMSDRQKRELAEWSQRYSV